MPTCYGRDGETLDLHGSTGVACLRAGGSGESEVCVVILLDGVVYGRSMFHHSVNYRAAVVHGGLRGAAGPLPVTRRVERPRPGGPGGPQAG
ncbi:MAG TPA: pyridoxamine 5'-phosphate oxidase family protein [Mycobacteriales bacterium]|nr:pyridoxamine 5'-phosphate oxidase family protein [Mycobacteriales bacterium]